MKLEILPEAEDELAAGHDYYENEREGLGKEFLDEMAEVMAQIVGRPLRFPPLRRSTARRALGKRFPYHVVFFVFPDRVRVIAVAHAKQRPRYWRKRT